MLVAKVIELETSGTTNIYDLRGKCKELSEDAVRKDPSLTLVRGYYYCPIWNREEQHWWTTRKNGSIYDPTMAQFPSRGMGTYTPFDGQIACSECGRIIEECDSEFDGRYAFCSTLCHGKFVGVF